MGIDHHPRVHCARREFNSLPLLCLVVRTDWLQTITFSDLFVDPTDNKVYHIEVRPEDNARYVIVDTLAARDVIPSPFSAHTGVHEYGGAAAIAYAGILYFSDAGDNRVYSVKATEERLPEPVTPGNPDQSDVTFR